MKTFLGKTIVVIGLVMFTAVLIVSIIAIISPPVIETNNHFTRRFVTSSIAVLNTLPIKQVRSICSVSENEIYLNTEQPNILLKTNDLLQHLDTIHLNFLPGDTIATLFDTYVDSSRIYIAAGNAPSIISIAVDSNVAHYYHFPKATFTASALIGTNTFVFRAYKKNSGKWDQVFIKGNVLNGNTTEEKGISETNGDAGFSTDGLLCYDKLSNKIVYVFHYRSSFICMDTNLNLEYRARTIDSTNFINIKAISVGSGKDSMFTNVTPLRDINLLSCVNNGKLFNVSKQKAGNEIKSQFENNVVVDVYRIIDSSYEGSFYIPFYNGEKMQDFKVSGEHIIVLYATYMVTYKLPAL